VLEACAAGDFFFEIEAMSYRVGERVRALRFFVVREINCGDWLPRGYMLAHQHCDLFYSLGLGSDWVYHKLGNGPVLRSGTGSWVLSG